MKLTDYRSLGRSGLNADFVLTGPQALGYDGAWSGSRQDGAANPQRPS
jgi:hypothetical protein